MQLVAFTYILVPLTVQDYDSYSSSALLYCAANFEVAHCMGVHLDLIQLIDANSVRHLSNYVCAS